MDVTERAAAIDAKLKTLYPSASIALRYESDFQLLVAVILSAQTTDVGVNKVTPVLFERFHTATSRQVVYEALCSGLESLTQPAMSAGTTS